VKGVVSGWMELNLRARQTYASKATIRFHYSKCGGQSKLALVALQFVYEMDMEGRPVARLLVHVHAGLERPAKPGNQVSHGGAGSA